AGRAETHEAVLDTGLQQPEHGGRIFAAAYGATEQDITLNLDDEAVPDEERLTGEHIDASINDVQEQLP
ncbi:MAG: hypothetical protein ABEI52_00320, partial [Halobacteriaceae archaeon]